MTETIGVTILPGKYVLAVSGGVDSMVLLDMMRQKSGIELVIAHFDHGIRVDSIEDRKLVAAVAKTYGLPFVYEAGNLGLQASEATARQARYTFLHQVRQAYQAAAIITAHHQDDVLETAIINLLRGTGRKGLSALADKPLLRRPLLDIPKQDLLSYAVQHNIAWREDSTNADPSYLRNYVRQKILSSFDEAARERLLVLIKDAATVNAELDGLLTTQLQRQSSGDKINRAWFNAMPHNVAKEIMADWLRAHDITNFDRQGLERLVIGAKISSAGQTLDVIRHCSLLVEKDYLALTTLER